MNEEYYLGECKICNKVTALKNGICNDCKDNDMPDFLKDLFGGNNINN
jgi:hypothetical protein